MNRIFCFFQNVFVISLLATCFAASAGAQTAVPAEVKAIVGVYTGAWTSYGLNANGEVVKQAAWTDAMRAENPAIEKDRAFVATIDEMTFEGGRIPPQKIQGREGYLLNKDGSLGDYFIEIFGQSYKMQRLDKDVWAYTTPVNAREFPALGDKFVSGTHVLVKNVVVAAGAETHHISRLTTVRWRDANGRERATQFVSLQGEHRRQTK